MKRVVVGTRGSRLALWQARHVSGLLRSIDPDLEIVERILHAEVDTRPEAWPAEAREPGVFVRRLEQALIQGEIDLAVHSLKDLPTEQPTELVLAAVLERHDPRDALLTVAGHTLDELPEATIVGTGSPRRRSQLLHLRPDLRIVPVRGNVDTRVERLLEGAWGALVLALCGIERLGIDSVAVQPLDTDVCLPAVGQGALAVEVRRDDRATRGRVAPLGHEPTLAAVRAERAFLGRLGGGCLAPATAYARVERERLFLEARVGEVDGSALLIDRDRGSSSEGEILGVRLAERMLDEGARNVLLRAREAPARSDERD